MLKRTLGLALLGLLAVNAALTAQTTHDGHTAQPPAQGRAPPPSAPAVPGDHSTRMMQMMREMTPMMERMQRMPMHERGAMMDRMAPMMRDMMPMMQEMMKEMMKNHHPAQATSGTVETPSTKAFKAANDRMHKDMAITFSGNADVDFVRGMIPHHEGAVAMAKVVLEFGKNVQTRKWAADIIREQEREIAEMNEWLRVNAP
jgi:uncharacterized protein (DUF305 family)